tara:strand:+ start:9742 stop:11040 length:1299 start_codon:yes stop_codon:yes gene_type:complete
MNKIDINKIFDELFPICRSITGKGYEKSLKILSKYMKFKFLRYSSGKKVGDWTVPKEWNIDDAFIEKNGTRYVDFKKNNLHVLNYSAPINKNLPLDQIKKNLYTIKKQPNLIPYVTSYYKKNWGFCIEYNKLKKLKNTNYRVVIKSSFKKGNVINGLSKIKGRSKKSILLSSYLCHPSMANNELSGPLVLLGLYNKIKKWKIKNYSYDFLVNPETIGSICFISSHKQHLKKNVKAGLVLTCLGGPKNQLSYKKSRIGTSTLDKLFSHLSNKKDCLIREFTPDGSDERQYCSSELNLPIGQVSRTIYGKYNQYHTSGDDKNFMKIKKIDNSISYLEKVLKINDYIFPLKRFIPFGELQLGKRNLYPNVNFYGNRNNSSDKIKDNKKQLKIMKYILSYSDSNHDIIDIADKSNFTIEEILEVLKLCLDQKLLKI